jgi:DnaK suppressor protein
MADITKGAGPRTDLDLEYFRRRLMEEKAAAEGVVSANTVMDSGALAIGSSDDDETRSMEGGTDLTRRGQDAALVGNARQILSRIERALVKMDEGTYGLSDKSGKPIPAERLDAVPYAVLTVEEQEKYGG